MPGGEPAVSADCGLQDRQHIHGSESAAGGTAAAAGGVSERGSGTGAEETYGSAGGTCRYVLLPGVRPPDSGNARGEPGGNPPEDPGCPEAGRPVPLGRGDSESAGRRADLSGKILCNPGILQEGR